MKRLDDAALDLIFRNARTYTAWLPTPVPERILRSLYELLRWGPTSANSSPLRLVFVQTPQAKQQLLGCMNRGNVEQTRTAPVTAILGMDMEFHEQLPRLYPRADARSWFAGNPALIESTAFRNSSLQGGYFIVAARALGLDCGPMSGFDAARLNAAFFPDGKVKVNFVCNLGHGDPAGVAPRSPRLDFDEACRVA
jgi:3-hydroxypropanoate dehydrogenase